MYHCKINLNKYAFRPSVYGYVITTCSHDYNFPVRYRKGA